MSEKIGVVIPYFQRRPGILARTLQGIAKQRDVADMLIVVVDDSSPIPAENEVKQLPPSYRRLVSVIRQPNAGPARARNTGLDVLTDTVDYIALCDSDDIWPDWHLHDAISALGSDFDVFFGDHIREATTSTHFASLGIDAAAHSVINPDRQHYCWRGDLFDTVLRRPIMALSTTVYRARTLGSLRFCESVGLADDLYFGLDVARAAQRVAFSTRQHAVYGIGENISVVTDWRSNKALFNQASLARYNAKLLVDFPLNEDQRRFVKDRLRRSRRDFAATLLAMLKVGIPVDKALVVRFLREQPTTLLAVLAVGAEVLRRRIYPAISAPG